MTSNGITIEQLLPDAANKIAAMIFFSVFASASNKQITTAPIWVNNPNSMKARTAFTSEFVVFSVIKNSNVNYFTAGAY